MIRSSDQMQGEFDDHDGQYDDGYYVDSRNLFFETLQVSASDPKSRDAFFKTRLSFENTGCEPEIKSRGLVRSGWALARTLQLPAKRENRVHLACGLPHTASFFPLYSVHGKRSMF